MLGCSLGGAAPPTPAGERRGTRGRELLPLLLLLLLVSRRVLAQEQAPCPKSCECSEAARTVKCVNKNLTEVPAQLPHYVQSLFLMGNSISHLSAATFLSEPQLNVTHLNLSSNGLEWVGSEAFAGLPRLRQLDLGSNALVEISPTAFGSTGSPLEELRLASSLRNSSLVASLARLLQRGTLLNLQRLDLSSNSLLYLPTAMLSQLPSLRHLDLHNNSLLSLRNVSLWNLHQLQSFDLGDNALKCLQNDTLQQLRSLPRLTMLNLSRNSWVCDCDIEDMASWLKHTEQVQAKGALLCSYPEEMENRSLVSLDFAQLSCPRLPDNQSQLQTSYVFLGIVLALIGAIFLLVLYLNRKGIKKWMYNIRDACRDHMEGYHYRYEINADPRLTNLSSNSDV